MVWNCLVILVRFKKWLNECVIGNSFLFVRVCSILISVCLLVLLLLCDDLDKVWIFFILFKMVCFCVFLMVWFSICLSILILLWSVVYCLFIFIFFFLVKLKVFIV